MSDEHTARVIDWVHSRPVLLKWLDEIVREGGDDELMCTVVDLLDPRRGIHAAAFLNAVGAPATDADDVSRALERRDGQHWLTLVDWPAVRRAVLSHRRRDCRGLCSRPHSLT